MVGDLMTSKRFAPLFWCQFCSALNDNFLKNALVMLVLFGFDTKLAPQSPETAKLLTTLSGVILIAPFFFLSAIAGELADKYDKATVATHVKFWEIAVALVAALGFYLHSIPILFVALLGFGIMAALFGPVKYGILPEKLTTAELTTGNALVEGATFLAILFGTIGGSIAVTKTDRPEVIVGIIMVLLVICWMSARSIPRSGAAAPEIVVTPNPLTSTLRELRDLRASPRLDTGGHITSWFWLVGVVAMSLLPVLVKETLGGNEDAITGALIAFTVGIAAGSMLAAQSGHDTPNLAVVPVGGIGIIAFALVLAWVSSGTPPASATRGLVEVATSSSGILAYGALFGLALFGGLYIVPAFAAVQAWAPEDKRARTVASVNILNAAYMTAGGIGLGVLQALGVPLSALYLILAVGTAGFVWFILTAWRSEGAAAYVGGPAARHTPT
jgi:acyl-[acyl-carrier-protein]-phospholipid O-acyltransferase/long-chain-fatty-acid--[acyl-carrier-protein] ligase